MKHCTLLWITGGGWTVPPEVPLRGDSRLRIEAAIYEPGSPWAPRLICEDRIVPPGGGTAEACVRNALLAMSGRPLSSDTSHHAAHGTRGSVHARRVLLVHRFWTLAERDRTAIGYARCWEPLAAEAERTRERGRFVILAGRHRPGRPVPPSYPALRHRAGSYGTAIPRCSTMSTTTPQEI